MPSHLATLTPQSATHALRTRVSYLLRRLEPAWSDATWKALPVCETDQGRLVLASELEAIASVELRREAVREEPRALGMVVLPDGTRCPGRFLDFDLLRIVLPVMQLLEADRTVFRRVGEPFVSEAAMVASLRERFVTHRHELWRPRLPAPEAWRLLATERMSGLDFIVSPWTFRDGVIDLPAPCRWISWVATAQQRRSDERTLAHTLVRFLRRFDSAVRDVPDHRVVFELDAVLGEIEAVHGRAT